MWKEEGRGARTTFVQRREEATASVVFSTATAAASFEVSTVSVACVRPGENCGEGAGAQRWKWKRRLWREVVGGRDVVVPRDESSKRTKIDRQRTDEKKLTSFPS